ncbi:M20 family metallo-hydrolase [Pseudonocardia sp.]|uniref:M20 family metallo-hydrolase n=1 Tax=Pseudonocardia sp. TaxID=60912 RepID=UPI003D10401E
MPVHPLPARDAAADDRLLADFAELSAIGATPAGGVERQAATPEDGATRSWLARWLADRGFTVVADRVGNQFGLLELVPDAPYVLAGSHLDSQPRGGRFDGAYGVLAAAHAADRLRAGLAAAGRTPRYNVAVVNWFNEEGSRFEPSMMGSAVFTGLMPPETALGTTDVAGTTVADALTAIGALGERDVFGAGAPHTVAGYVEIHIEQGRELDKSGTTLGLVHRTWAANKYQISVLGEQAHTGATAIADRRDALYGAALAVVALRDLADRYGEELHTSCGRLTVLPNSPVVVPREVRMHLDLRSPSDALLAEADAALRATFAEIEVKADVRIERHVAHTWTGQDYPPAGVALAREVARDLGVSFMPVQTRAGHDSTNLKNAVPTVMLFIPSVEGISHAEAEFTADADLCRGLDVLTETLARMVEGALDRA